MAPTPDLLQLAWDGQVVCESGRSTRTGPPASVARPVEGKAGRLHGLCIALLTCVALLSYKSTFQRRPWRPDVSPTSVCACCGEGNALATYLRMLREVAITTTTTIADAIIIIIIMIINARRQQVSRMHATL